MASERVASRRRHSEQLKAQLLEECEVSGASVAKVSSRCLRGITSDERHDIAQVRRRLGQPALFE